MNPMLHDLLKEYGYGVIDSKSLRGKLVYALSGCQKLNYLTGVRYRRQYYQVDYLPAPVGAPEVKISVCVYDNDDDIHFYLSLPDKRVLKATLTPLTLVTPQGITTVFQIHTLGVNVKEWNERRAVVGLFTEATGLNIALPKMKSLAER